MKIAFQPADFSQMRPLQFARNYRVLYAEDQSGARTLMGACINKTIAKILPLPEEDTLTLVAVDNGDDALNALKGEAFRLAETTTYSSVNPAPNQRSGQASEKRSFDAAVIDQTLPGQNGLNVAEVAKEKQIPVAILTTQSDPANIQAIQNLDVPYYVVPLSLDEIIALWNNLLQAVRGGLGSKAN